MAKMRLIDCFNVTVGGVAIARGGTFERTNGFMTVQTRGDAVPGNYSNDKTVAWITARLTAQDPLILPSILALSWPQVISASGRDVDNIGSYYSAGLANAVLTGFSIEINDNGAGSLSLDFRNKTPTDTAFSAANLAIQMPTAGSAAAPSLPDRQDLIRILPTSSFTPSGGAAVTLPAIKRLQLQGSGNPVGENFNPGQKFEDKVAVLDWQISGSIDIPDQQLIAGLPISSHLTTLIRGDLALVCEPAGGSEGAVVNQTLTVSSVVFTEAGNTLNTKDDAAGRLALDVLLRLADTPLDPADVIAFA